MIRFNCCDREYIVTDNSKILVHEHVFNLYHYSNRNLSIEYTLSLLENLASKGYDIIVDLTPYSKVWNYYEIIEKSPVNIISCVGFFTGKYLTN